MNPELIEQLKKAARTEVACEQEGFNAYDYSGGNFDDAYSLGCEDGETLLAREILEKLGLDWS